MLITTSLLLNTLTVDFSTFLCVAGPVGVDGPRAADGPRGSICVLSDIKFEVNFLYRYRYLGDSDTDRYEILHDATYWYRHFFPF